MIFAAILCMYTVHTKIKQISQVKSSSKINNHDFNLYITANVPVKLACIPNKITIQIASLLFTIVNRPGIP